METIISPSILSADFANLENEIIKVRDLGAKWVHIDVMDGHFVPNITIGAPVVKSLRKIDNIKLDVHLMIENPKKYVEDFIAAKSDIITFHYEAAREKTQELIDKIQASNILAGVSIKPKTKVDEIKEYIKTADLILVMTVEPGFGGQAFMEDCAEKISQIKEIAKNIGRDDLIIQVDGGINEKTGKICKNLGANSLVAGSYIFNSSNVKEAINSLF